MTMANSNKQISSGTKNVGRFAGKSGIHAENTGNSRARVAGVQWRMRTFSSIEDFLIQVENHVQSLAAYKCDIVLFPEFFTPTICIGLIRV